MSPNDDPRPRHTDDSVSQAPLQRNPGRTPWRFFQNLSVVVALVSVMLCFFYYIQVKPFLSFIRCPPFGDCKDTVQNGSTPSSPVPPASTIPAVTAASVIFPEITPITFKQEFLSSFNPDLVRMFHALHDDAAQNVDELLQSSIPNANKYIMPRENGFIQTILEAYNGHHALIIRPDDVWLAILTQFNFFVNGNAESLRSQFVNHTGKIELQVVAGGNRYSVDFGQMAMAMTRKIEEKTTTSLRNWILPNFTTTTTNDVIVSSIVMMATMQEYFTYKFSLICGIPRITLEGEKADWEEILKRLDKLKGYGVETLAWYHLLVPVVSRFVRTFEDPQDPDIIDFWKRILHYESYGSGSPELGGWITAFAVFTSKGEWMGMNLKKNSELDLKHVSLSSSEFFSIYTDPPIRNSLILDGTPYHHVDTDTIPPGFAKVDVLLDDNGKEFPSFLTAGQIGAEVVKGETGEYDTVKPVAAWWLFTKSGTTPQGEENQRPLSD